MSALLSSVALLAVLSCAAADSAVWVDPRGVYFRSSGQGQPLSAASNAHATAALLGLRPFSAVSAAESAELNTLLAGQTVFDRPATLLSVQLVGVGAGALGELPAGAVVTPLLGDSMQVAAALAPLDGVALSVRCAVACGSACLSAQLGGAAPALAVGEAYSEALAQELSCFLDALRLQLAQQPDARLITARLSALPPTLLNGPQAGAAAAALRATLAAALTQLQASRGDAAALHIVLLDSAPAAPLPSRRALLQAPSQLGRDVNAWYAKVAAFGVGILLLVAILGTIVALCTMPTGQDTLLYAKHKGE